MSKSIIIRDENYTHMDDWNSDNFKIPEIGAVMQHDKVKYEVIDVQSNAQQVVLTVKKVEDD